MDEIARLLVLLAVGGVALTALGGVVIWRMDEGRRTRRGLRTMLKGDTHGLLVARGRGRGVGFNFTHNKIACSWDQGAWGLVYDLEELIGAEAIADGQVVARVHRGETRRALDSLGGADRRVALRLVFDDVTYPEFVLELWLPSDAGRRDELAPEEALEECNRWLARIEALFRRPSPRRDSPPPVVASSVPTPAGADGDADGQADDEEDEALS